MESTNQLGNFLRRLSSKATKCESDDRVPNRYRIITLLIALPIVVGMSFWVKKNVQEEERNYQRPPFVPYEHLRIRNKRFPWGDGNKTLFHNPKKNALPDGYEDE